jgi:phage virion morphogenesis protein
MIKFTINTVNTTSDKFNNLLRKLNNLHDFLSAIGDAVLTHTQLSFDSEQDPYGNKWQPLSETTKSLRRGNSYQILRDTAVLMSSFSKQEPSKNSIVVGTPIIYSTTHQYGAKKGAYGSYTTKNGHTVSIPWGDVPARPMLPDTNRGWPVALEENVIKLFYQHIL